MNYETKNEAGAHCSLFWSSHCNYFISLGVACKNVSIMGCQEIWKEFKILLHLIDSHTVFHFCLWEQCNIYVNWEKDAV